MSIDKCLRLTTGHCERDTAASAYEFTAQPTNNTHCNTYFKKVKADIALPTEIPISELRDVTCHMGSHSVTCHLTQVIAPRLTTAMQAGTHFTCPGGMEGWVDLVDLIAPWPGVEPAQILPMQASLNRWVLSWAQNCKCRLEISSFLDKIIGIINNTIIMLYYSYNNMSSNSNNKVLKYNAHLCIICCPNFQCCCNAKIYNPIPIYNTCLKFHSRDNYPSASVWLADVLDQSAGQQYIGLIIEDRCFMAAGPRLWNSRPAGLRQTDIDYEQSK